MASRVAVRVLSLPILLLAPFLYGFANPHDQPGSCDFCHFRIPTAVEAERGDYSLVRDTIDETCGICHEENRYLSGAGCINHPSNINRWDWNELRAPKTLPLFDGFITCHTCHLHSKADDGGYKMVRIVEIHGDRVDWSELCRDCHDH